jgi:polyisoprenoid-binding protein YceI
MTTATLRPLLVLTSMVAALALGADGNLDAGKSTLVATFKQENVPVDAPFKHFSGTITYNASNPAASNAALDVDMSSLDIGSDDYNAEVRKKPWFDSATYPKATFRSTAIKAGAAGHFTATGTLTIKGRAQTINVPISVQTVGGAMAFDGTFELSRAAFAIGDPQWNDVLDDKTRVCFHLVTTH